MFRALLLHHQEILHERRFDDYCVQPTSTTAHNNHQKCVRVVPPDEGQVIPETCREFEPQ
jgi:hypothetical protein